MKRALVTGAAGFIGSHLCQRLLDEGIQIRAVDSFDPYYDRGLKERNLQPLLADERFEFREIDLAEGEIAPLLESIDCVFHQAARAGVRASWGSSFSAYVRPNIIATQRLLEGLRGNRVIRLVFASSSSVYGEGAGKVTAEDSPRRPISPYGVTKLAGEGLVSAYHADFGLPTVMLRYFTVYGPRQRPDMAFHRFLRAAVLGEEIEVYGDGRQRRDFTYVSDAVEANLLAAKAGEPGAVYNIGGGSPASVCEVIETMEAILGRELTVRHAEPSPGDPRETAADITRAREALGFAPQVPLRDGLDRMAAWMQELMGGDRA